MRNPLTLLPRLSQQTRRQTNTRLMPPLLGFAIWCAGMFGAGAAIAATPDTAPPELKNLLSEIDAAANARDLEGVMQFYSKNLSHADGLTHDSLKRALSDLWQRYPKLSYRTELVSWQADGSGIVAETVTTITGTQSMTDREVALSATVRGRQRYENQTIVRQEILAERSQLTSGENPPKVEVKLPEQVRPGQEFNFDAIVVEPLGDNLLIGAALEESAKAETYFTPPQLKLEPLAAGGIFKVGRAPAQADSRWISAVLVRHDGMTMITQRLRVVGSNTPSSSANP